MRVWWVRRDFFSVKDRVIDDCIEVLCLHFLNIDVYKMWLGKNAGICVCVFHI